MIVGTWTAMGAEGWQLSKGYAGGDMSKVTHLLLPKDARIIDADTVRTIAFDSILEVRRLLRAALKTVENDDEHKLITYQAKYLEEEFFGNPTVAALLHRYEAVEVFKDNQLVVLNRSRLIVEK